MAMKWDTDDDNNVIWKPVAGFHVAPAAETIVMVRIECSPTPNQSAAIPGAVQLGMTPMQALQLAADLRETAEHILAMPQLTKPN
jgi:hypothetical protein